MMRKFEMMGLSSSSSSEVTGSSDIESMTGSMYEVNDIDMDLDDGYVAEALENSEDYGKSGTSGQNFDLRDQKLTKNELMQ